MSKGCDLGYALATGSCEGVSSVDACTVTASDVITAFAVPNPSWLLAGPAGFFGLGWPTNYFIAPITQSISDQLRFIEASPFDRRLKVRHWLCSGHQLLRENQQLGYMYRRNLRCDHCFRSPQSQPAPRRACWFFRAGVSGKLLCLPDHSVYFGLNEFLFHPAFQLPTGTILNQNRELSRTRNCAMERKVLL
jgi:hypothetical protein